MPFQRGRSGNPKGRPPQPQAMTELLRKELNKKRDNIPARQLLVKQLVDLALAGDLKAIIYVFDRLDGKPQQSIAADLSGQLSGASDISGMSREEEEKRLDELVSVYLAEKAAVAALEGAKI